MHLWHFEQILFSPCEQYITSDDLVKYTKRLCLNFLAMIWWNIQKADLLKILVKFDEIRFAMKSTVSLKEIDWLW